MSAWEVRGKTFVKLMVALEESALMYGAEVWGSCKWLDCIEQVQLRAYRLFLGLLIDGVATLKWEATKRYIKFW